MLKFLSGLKQSLGLMPRQYGSSRIVLPQDQKEGSTVFSVFPFALEGDWTMKTKTKWHWVLLIRFVLLSSPCCGSHHLARQTSEESLMSATFSFIEGVWSEAKSAATETISSLVEELDQAVSEAAIHIVTEGRSEAAVCESLLEDKQIPNVVQCSCSVGFSVTTANCKAFKYEFEHNGAKFLGSTFTVARASFTKVSGATSLDVTSCYQHMNDSRRYKRVCLLLEHGKGLNNIESLAKASVRVERERCRLVELCSELTLKMDCSNIELTRSADLPSVRLPSTKGKCVHIKTLSAVNNGEFGEITYGGIFNPFDLE